MICTTHATASEEVSLNDESCFSTVLVPKNLILRNEHNQQLGISLSGICRKRRNSSLGYVFRSTFATCPKTTQPVSQSPRFLPFPATTRHPEPLKLSRRNHSGGCLADGGLLRLSRELAAHAGGNFGRCHKVLQRRPSICVYIYIQIYTYRCAVSPWCFLLRL